MTNMIFFLTRLKTWSKFHAYKILFLVMFLMYGWCFFGIDYQDTFFFLNLANGLPLSETPFMTFLSTYVISGIIKITGGVLIWIRIFNMSLYFIGFCLPLLFFTKNNRKIVALKISILIVLFSPYFTNIFGAGTFSTLSIIITGILSLKYMQTLKNIYLVGLLISVTCAILFRFPNVLLVPFIGGAIVLDNIVNKRKQWNQVVMVVLSLFLSLLAVSLVYYIIYGSFGSMIETGNVSSSDSHSFKSLIGSYIGNFIFIFKVLLAFFVFYILDTLIKKGVKKRVLSNTLRLLILIVVVYFIYDYVLFKSSYHRIYGMVLIGIIALATLGAILNQWRNKDMVYPIFIFLIMLVAALGSNTGLYKMIHVLPLLIMITYFNTIVHQKNLFFFLILLLPLSVVGRFNGVFQDASINNLNTMLEEPKFVAILTTQLRKENIEDILAKMDEQQDKNIYVFGQSSHIFNYINDKPPLFIDFTQELDDKRMIEFIDSKANSAFYIYDYPDAKVVNAEDVIKDINLDPKYKMDSHDNYIIISKIANNFIKN